MRSCDGAVPRESIHANRATLKGFSGARKTVRGQSRVGRREGADVFWIINPSAVDSEVVRGRKDIA